MGQNRLSGSPLAVQSGGTGRLTLPAAGLLYGLGSGNLLGSVGPGNPGEVVKLKSGQPLSLPGDRILQAVMGSYSTEVQLTDQVNWIPTGLTCSITPLYADSKILVLVNQSGVGKSSGAAYLGLSLWRGATNLLMFGYPIGWTNESTAMSPGTASHNHLDNPATTTTLTYSTKGKVFGSAGTCRCQWVGPSANYGTSTLVLLEVASS